MAKFVGFFVAIFGAVSAFFAMVALRNLQRKQARVELLKARQAAREANEEASAKLEEEITKTTAPVLKLTDSKEDREDLAALLDE
jgi:3-polyprenyl-4-hydroxybenzoate decarboxylase